MMRTYPECFQCMMRQALEACRLAGADEETTWRAMVEAARALTGLRRDWTPLENSCKVHGAVNAVLGTDDPYKEVKERANAEARTLLELARRDIESSDDRLREAIIVSVAGNAADYGPASRMSLPEALRFVKEKGFAVDHYRELKEALEEAERVAVLGDNAGEIVLDIPLLEQLSDRELHYFVKERPLINDATVLEAEGVGIGDYATIEAVPFLDGIIALRSPYFLERLKGFDVVIAKGQGNFETLSDVGLGIFFAFLAKCEVVARYLGVEPWSPMLVRM